MRENKRLDMTLTLHITDQGEPFHSSTVTWNEVPYVEVLEIEKRLIAFLSGMQEMGVAQWRASVEGSDSAPK